MPEQNNLADIVSSEEGTDAFKDVKDEEGKDTSQASPAEKETKEEKSPSSQGEPEEKSEEKTEDKSEEESEKDESEDESKEETKDDSEDKTEKAKQIPFHKHPRWKERERQFNKKLDTLKKESDEKLKLALEDIKKSTEPKSIPKWFKGLYGDDKEMWNEYQEGQRTQRESLKKEILREQQERRDKETTETEKWSGWVDSEVVKLKADGKVFNKNELLKIALEYKPIDDNGNISLEKAYDLLQKLKVKDTKKSTARKKLADSTISKTKGEQSPKDWKTPKDFEGNRW